MRAKVRYVFAGCNITYIFLSVAKNMYIGAKVVRSIVTRCCFFNMYWQTMNKEISLFTLVYNGVSSFHFYCYMALCCVTSCWKCASMKSNWAPLDLVVDVILTGHNEAFKIWLEVAIRARTTLKTITQSSTIFDLVDITNSKLRHFICATFTVSLSLCNPREK
jgi:hypothetical protein